MKIHCLEVGALQCNCYLIEKDDQAVLIDCGGNGEEIFALCERLGVFPSAILLTHGHVDHVEGVDAVVAAYDCPVYLHKEDGDFFENPAYNLSTRVYLKPLVIRANPILFEDGDCIAIGAFSVKVIHTPGHTPGSVCFKIEDVLFTGDTLFRDSVGNEFPPLGSFATEIESIQSRLFTLGDDYTCYPGHGGATSLFYEKQNNQYCRL